MKVLKILLFLIVLLNIIITKKYSKFELKNYSNELFKKELIKSLFSGNFINPILLNLDANNINDTEDIDDSLIDYTDFIEVENMFYDILRGELEITLARTNLSGKCSQTLSNSLLSNITEDYYNKKQKRTISMRVVSNYYIKKLIEDSSKHINDLGTYQQCVSSQYTIVRSKSEKINKTEYVIFTLDKSEKIDKKTKELEFQKKRLNFEQIYYVRAFCLPQAKEDDYEEFKCTENDYLNFMNNLDEDLSYILGIKDVTDTRILLMESPKYEKSSIDDFKSFLRLIPFFLLVFHIIITIFRTVIVYIFENYLYKKKNVKTQEDLSKDLKSINKENTKKKENNDDDDENDEEDEDENNNKNKKKEKKDSKKENILPVWVQVFNKCFNFVDNFKELFNFSLNSTIINNDSGLFYIRGLKASFLFFLIFGLTFMTMINSLSKIISNTLFYEFINNYLFYSIFFIGLRYAPRIIFSCSGYTLAYKYLCYIKKNKLTCSSIFRFILYQIHKYLILISFFIFERFTLHTLFEKFIDTSPFWEYLNTYLLQRPGSGRFVLSFFALSSIFTTEERNSRYYQTLIDYFWLPYNEVFFFLIGLIIMSVGYKYRLRIDYFLIILTLVLFIFKLFYSYLIRAKNDELYYATLYYYLFDYGKFMTNPIFNLSSYLIGMYFGLINYSVQKGITTYEDSNTIYDNAFGKTEEEKELKYIGPEDKKIGEEESEDDMESHGPINDDKDYKKESQYRIEIIEMPFLLFGTYITKWLRNKKKMRLIYCLIIFLIIFFIFVHFIVLHTTIGNDYSQKQNDLDKIYSKCESVYNNYYENIDDYSEIDEMEENCDIETGELSKEIQNLLLLEKYITNKFANFIFRIDIEIVVILLQSLLFILYFKGQNFINDFYCHVFWAMLNKSYFSFILVANPMILFIFYQSESKMLFNLYNLLLYSLISGCLVFLCSTFTYLFFELPYKKLIHYICSDDFKEQDKDLDDDEDKDEKSDEDEDD